jgi:hypothetical protein
VSYFLPIEQDELAGFVLSFGNASSRCLISQAKIEALNPYHRRRPPFSDRPTPTIHYYKKSSQSWSLSPSLNRVSILPPPEPEHHFTGAPPTIVIPFPHCPTPNVHSHNDIDSDELFNSLSLSK